MSTGFKFRAYPEPEVAQVLLRWIGCQRFIKNAKVREDQYYRSFQRRFLEFAGQYAPVDQAYSHLIGDGGGNPDADTTWLRQVPSQVLRNGAALFYTAYKRFFKGLAKRPSIKGRHGEQSVWLTSELFSFKDVTNAEGVVISRRLIIGTPKYPCGELSFVVNKGCIGPDGKRTLLDWNVPSSIHVSVNAGRWHVSFSNEAQTGDGAGAGAGKAKVLPSEQDTLDQLRQFSEAELLERTVGLDRGVVVPVMATTKHGVPTPFQLLPVQLQRLAHKQKLKARWQRRAARRVKGSKNRAKAYKRAAKAGLYAADVRNNFAHQTSRALVDGENILFVFEALRIKSMSATAKGTLEAPGKQVRQKAGLNRAILASSWGRVLQFTTYKALQAGKLAVEVSPNHSSQECSQCGFIHAANRISQSEFACQRCGHAENADANAGRVLALRGVLSVLTPSFTLRERKQTGGLRRRDAKPKEDSQSVGPERSEYKPVEIRVSRKGQTSFAHRSAKQEFLGATQDAPTTTPCV